MPSERLTDRTAIVTGAAAGIGRAIAHRFAREGASLLMVDRAADRLAAVERELRDMGRPAIGLIIDIAAPEAPETIVGECMQHWGRIDILVNNAGVGGSRPVAELAEGDWRATIEIDLTAQFRLAKAALPHVTQSPHGRIINMASVFGLVGFPTSSSYAVAKAGLIALTRSMAVDYAPRGITVNAIAPGLIITEMSQRNLDTKPWFRRLMAEATPAPHMGAPDDIAGAALFLASDDASFVNGHTLVVDGGWSTARYQAGLIDAP
jgi:NAD(P)-dependent dehydrogenase (short-subunit alcohol dehydrogenase family)